jgi:predicted TIM-barrel fold metal-dependent hydrolase
MGFIDADAHVDETEQTWEYMEADERRFKPSSFTHDQQEQSFMRDARQNRLWMINGQARLRRFRDDKVTGTTRDTRELIDVEARLRHMDELGIDVQVLYPTTFLHTATDRPEVELGLYKTYNRWLADRTANSGGRLRWACLAPMLSIDKAIEELRFAKEHGACGVLKKGVECGDRGAADSYFFPLYEEAERLDLPICLHQGDGNAGRSNAGDGVRLQELYVLSAFEQLAQQGVPDKFPGLRFGFIETGASWIPYLLKSLGMRGRAARYDFDFKSGFLAHNRFYVSCDTEDDLPYLLQFGEDNLFIGTDYSHADASAELGAHRVLIERADRGELSAAAVRKITSDNARRFYGLQA